MRIFKNLFIILMIVFAVGLFFYFCVFYKSPPTLLEFLTTDYESNDYSVQYHSIDGIETNIGDKGFFVKKKDGKMEYMKWTDIPNRSIYFTPGAFWFGPSNYVPSYEDTVYMKYFTQKQ